MNSGCQVFLEKSVKLDKSRISETVGGKSQGEKAKGMGDVKEFVCLVGNNFFCSPLLV